MTYSQHVYDGMVKENQVPDHCFKCESRYVMDQYKKFSSTDRAMSQVGVPQGFAKAHVNDFEPERIQRLPDKIETPGMLIIGEPSIGKTHLAAALTRRELQHHVVPSRDHPNQMVVSGMWANVHNILAEIRQTFGDRANQSETELLKKYIAVEFLVMDDMGTEKQSEWAMSTICNIVDGRMNLDKVTLITSNMNMKDWMSLDTRIAARFSAYTVVKFKGRDRRKAKGKVVEL